MAHCPLCPVSDRARCDSCGDSVTSESRHSHHYKATWGKDWDVTCGSCDALIAAAALPAIKAVFDALAGAHAANVPMERLLRACEGLVVDVKLPL